MANCKWHFFVAPWNSKGQENIMACYDKMLKGGKKTRRSKNRQTRKTRRNR